MNTNISQSVKVGLPSTCSIVGIILLCCKLFGVIDWSWWIVLLPFWGPVVAAVAIIAVVVLIAWIMTLCDRD